MKDATKVKNSKEATVSFGYLGKGQLGADPKEILMMRCSKDHLYLSGGAV